MPAPSTTGSRTARRSTAAVAAATALTLAGVALAAGAATAGATPGPASAQPSVAAAAGTGAMATLWGQTDLATRDAVCTAFQLDPAGTWQTLAPVLVDAGVIRAEALAVLEQQCSPERSVKDLRG
jgi:hypothetical protein